MIGFERTIAASGGLFGSAASGFFDPITTPEVFQDAIDHITGAIHAGVARIGERMPAERALAADMGVSRPSVSQAIKLLEWADRLAEGGP